MFYRDEEDRALFEAARVRADHTWDGGVVTEVTPLEEFYDAEEYHQDFFGKNLRGVGQEEES